MYLDLYIGKELNELNGEAVWDVDEIGDEFWNDPREPQFLFNCGPQTYDEIISENFSINNALDAELPAYIWPSSNLNRFIFYRLDAERELGKTLTYNEAVDIVAAHMDRLGIKRESL